MNAPTFVVVGCVNMGKSSLVATLAEQDWIPIDRRPGTTRRADAYDLRVDDETVLTIYDTPGFQNARRALAWMEDWRAERADRSPTWPEAMRAFRDAFTEEAGGAFVNEVRLLEPVLDGAGIVYVVNGSLPYHGRYEAEMRLLANTGAPRLAVVNLEHGRDPLPAWEEALAPYFKVHRFDALAAGFAERLALLASFAGVDERWAPAVERALSRLRAAGATRRERSAGSIADLLCDCLTMREEAPLDAEHDRSRLAGELRIRLSERLADRERAARRQVEHCYRHEHLRCAEAGLPLLDRDLLDRRSWSCLGFSRRQLAAAGAGGGALIGGTIDAVTGGADFQLGTAIGAALGGTGALVGARRLARVRILRRRLGGYRLRVTPPEGLAFAAVLLDRALIHWRWVSRRAHARRDRLELPPPDQSPVVAGLPGDWRRDLARLHRRLVKVAGEAVDEALRHRLADLVDRACLLLEEDDGDGSAREG